MIDPQLALVLLRCQAVRVYAGERIKLLLATLNLSQKRSYLSVGLT